MSKKRPETRQNEPPAGLCATGNTEVAKRNGRPAKRRILFGPYAGEICDVLMHTLHDVHLTVNGSTVCLPYVSTESV